eukprot:4425620-Ditylum_brightwellii.AAC.1
MDGKGGRDPSGLGQYTWQKIRGRRGIVLHIVTFYRPCRSAKGSSSVYAQHLLHFNKIGRFLCPQNALMEDLKKEITKWKKDKEQ